MIADKHLGFPDEEVMACEDGLVENHLYVDLRRMTFDDYHRWLTLSDSLLADKASTQDDYFSDNEIWVLGLDPEVAPVVAALSAIGCCPVTSCTGGSGHHEPHPLVLVWCEREHLRRIEHAAGQVPGVFVEGMAPMGVLIYSLSDPYLLRQFADVLHQQENGLFPSILVPDHQGATLVDDVVHPPV